MTFDGTSASALFSQNTAGLRLRRKKKGIKGKKNPRSTPCKTDDELEDEDARTDELPPSMLSIHCSSSARACSSSKG